MSDVIPDVVRDVVGAGLQDDSVTPAASTSGSRPLVRALEALDRSTPAAVAAVETPASPASEAAGPRPEAGIEVSARSGLTPSDAGPASPDRRAPRVETLDAPILRQVAAETGGGAASSDGQGGSARQEYGRRVFAAAAAFESERQAIPRAQGASLASEVCPEAPVAASTQARTPEANAVVRTSVPQATVEDADVVPQLVRAIRTQFRDGVGEARIRLNPEHLGEVRIDIKIEGDRVSARLQVERPEVRQAIEAESHSLRLHLARQGLTLEDLTVTEGSRPRDERTSSDERHRGQDRQPPERRSRRDQPEREFQLTTDD
jgi:flagellar hook-length control protein FliK